MKWKFYNYVCIFLKIIIKRLRANFNLNSKLLYEYVLQYTYELILWGCELAFIYLIIHTDSLVR